jgi:hypothetical protein
MTSGPGNHLASYPPTAAGSQALAAHLRDEHGIAVRAPYEGHAARSAMHAAAHENEAAAPVTIRPDPVGGRVLASAVSFAGEVTYSVAEETAGFIHVTPVDAFTYRGRRYGGTVMLKRADFTPDPMFTRMLTDADLGLPASGTACSAISQEVSRAVEAHVSAHPEVAAAGSRAAARLRSRQVARQIAEAEENLALLRAEHARLLEAAGDEQ